MKSPRFKLKWKFSIKIFCSSCEKFDFNVFKNNYVFYSKNGWLLIFLLSPWNKNGYRKSTYRFWKCSEENCPKSCQILNYCSFSFIMKVLKYTEINNVTKSLVRKLLHIICIYSQWMKLQTKRKFIEFYWKSFHIFRNFFPLNSRLNYFKNIYWSIFLVQNITKKTEHDFWKYFIGKHMGSFYGWFCYHGSQYIDKFSMKLFFNKFSNFF